MRPALRTHPLLALAVCYVAVATLGHLLWEAGQLPLSTIWSTGTPREIAMAVIHCTAGDVLITVATLLVAAVLIRLFNGPLFGGGMVLTTIVLGAAYTILSEWLNVRIWRNWAYAPATPVLLGTGTGLAPLLQWLIVPSVGFAIISGHRPRGSVKPHKTARRP